MTSLVVPSLSAIILFGALSACSTDTGQCTAVNQDQIYQSLSAGYDASTDTTYSVVTLRFSGPTGTTLELAGNCKLSHNRSDLTKSAFLGTSYYGSQAGFQPGHTFSFVTNDSHEFVNTGTIAPISFTGTIPATVSKTSDFKISFAGPVHGSETVTLHVAPAAGPGAYVSTSTVGDSSITMPATSMTDLEPGAGTLWLIRSSSTTPSQVTSAGGSLSLRYLTKPQTVVISK